MPAARSLADGHVKLILLTTKPVNPAAPTVSELTAGIDISCNVLASDFAFGPTDSDKVNEKALCTTGNANSLGPGNYEAGVTFFRYFDTTTGAPDATADAGFIAVKAKGTTVWLYARESGKLATAAIAAAQELYFGAEVVTDSPQKPSDGGGWIKRRVPMEVQNGWEYITVAA
jgi:hypothetical protein